MFKSKNTKLISFLAIFFVLAPLLLAPQAVKAGPAECDGKDGAALQECVESYLAKEKARRCPPGARNDPDYRRCLSQVMEDYIQAETKKRCAGKVPDQYEDCAKLTRDAIENEDFGYDGDADVRDKGNFEADCKEEVVTKDNCGIIAYLLDFINILSALVGITAVIMLTVWGIQYTVSRDNPQMVASARLKILNTVLAVVFYLFIYAFLQWVVPGGIF